MKSMRHAALILGLSFGTLSACSQPDGEPENLMAEGASVADCGDWRSNVEELERMRGADDALKKAVVNGRANAVEEAHRALDAKDYRLAAATTPRGISTEVYGVQCRVLGGLDPWTVRALGFVEDVEAASDSNLPDDSVTGFGRRYNATMLADPRYPYADVCRGTDKVPENEADFDVGPNEAITQPFGFSQIGVARMDHGLGAAARRGSVSDIHTLLKREGANVNGTDLFGLTPLAWAISYHRWPAAEALLKAGAEPTGAACQSAIDRESPLQIARIMRWSAMIRTMRPLVSEEAFASLRQNPRWDDASLSEFNHALTELKERFSDVFKGKPFTRHDLLFRVDEEGSTVECTMDPGSHSPEFDSELCGLAIEIVRWTPARDAFGVRVPESAKLVVGIGGN